MKNILAILLLAGIHLSVLAQGGDIPFNTEWESTFSPEDVGENQPEAKFNTPRVQGRTGTELSSGRYAVGGWVSGSPIILILSRSGELERASSRPDFFRFDTSVVHIAPKAFAMVPQADDQVMFFYLEGPMNAIFQPFQLGVTSLMGNPPVLSISGASSNPDNIFAAVNAGGFHVEQAEIIPNSARRIAVLTGRGAKIGSPNLYPLLSRQTGNGVNLESVMHEEVPVVDKIFFPTPPAVTPHSQFVYAVSGRRLFDPDRPEWAFSGYATPYMYLVFADSSTLNYQEHIRYDASDLGLPTGAGIQIHEVQPIGEDLHIIGTFRTEPFERSRIFITRLDDTRKVVGTVISTKRTSNSRVGVILDKENTMYFFGASITPNNNVQSFMMTVSPDLSSVQEYVWGYDCFLEGGFFDNDGNLILLEVTDFHNTPDGNTGGNLKVTKVLLAPVSVEEQNTPSLSLKLSPNPATTMLQCQVAEPFLNSTYSIVDFLGRTYLTGKVDRRQMSLPLHSMPSGVYMLSVVTDTGEHVVKRFVINR